MIILKVRLSKLLQLPNTKFNNRISGVEEDDLIEEEDKAAIIKAYESSRQDAVRKKSNEFTTLRNEINTRYKEEIDKINNSIAVARQLGEKNEGLSCPPSPLSEMRQIHDRLAKLQLEECASCGKEGNSGDMNTCNKCKMVKYCNAACKKKHRKKHKKDCKLFKEPPPNEECPICFLPFQYRDKTETFKTCCGKRICNGCIHAIWMSEGKDLCPFCRTQPPTSGQEEIKRLKKLMDKGNARAFFACGNHYHFGNTYLGLPQDHQKANELYLKAGELGCAAAYSNLGLSYDDGYGVERDIKKAKHYWELAAVGGDRIARSNLGVEDYNAGNYQRSMKHFMIATRAGNETSLDDFKEMYKHGLVTEDDYEKTLRAYHERQKEMKSEEREDAAASGFYDL